MKEEEFQKIWSLNKVGNVEHTRNILTYQIEQKEIYEDEVVDYNYLYNKYKKYKRWWTTKYGNRDEYTSLFQSRASHFFVLSY